VAEAPVQAELELAAGREAAAAAELADSDSEGRGCGGAAAAESVMDMVADSLAAGQAGSKAHSAGGALPPAERTVAAAGSGDEAAREHKRRKVTATLPSAAAAAAGRMPENQNLASQEPSMRDSRAALDARIPSVEHNSPVVKAEPACAAPADSRRREGKEQGAHEHITEAGADVVKAEQHHTMQYQAEPGVAGLAGEQQQGHVKAEEEVGGKLAAVEFLGDGCAQGRPLGALDLASFDSYSCACCCCVSACPYVVCRCMRPGDSA
jgi:hypothetical protein